MPDFFHGIRVVELTTGARPLTTPASAVIGLIATGADADADAFPLNRPVLVTNVRAMLAKAGTQGTLAKALSAISDQASPIIVVVRIFDGGDDAADAVAAIGGVAGGSYTGMQALLAAEAQLGVRPRILAAPGLDTLAVTNGLVVIAKRLRAMVYARAIGADVAGAILYAKGFGDRELMLLWPETAGGWSGDAVARAIGLRAQIDETTGWHKTLSNVPVAGITGLAKDVFFDLQDATTDAAVLNGANVATLIRSNGYRFWGNRTCSAEPAFAFEAATRTAQILQDTMAAGLMWAVDRPLTTRLIRDMLDTINADFRALTAQQRIIGALATFDAAQNDPTQLAAGRIVLDYEFTPCAPAEALTLNQRITDRFYASVVDTLTTQG